MRVLEEKEALVDKMLLAIGVMMALLYVIYILQRLHLAIARACCSYITLFFLVALFLSTIYYIFA